MTGVYQITNKHNNRRYIGCSKHIIKRWSNHLRDLKRNRHINVLLQNDFNILGITGFIFEVLEACNDLVKMKQIEDSYIKELTDNDYNIFRKPFNYAYSSEIEPIKINNLTKEGLLPHFLKYVLENTSDEKYNKTDRDVQIALNLSSEDKANRVRLFAVKECFLTKVYGRSYHVNLFKIDKFLRNAIEEIGNIRDECMNIILCKTSYVQNNIGFSNKTFKELLPYYLFYVLKNESNGYYEQTDKGVMIDFGLLSDDKPNRVKKLAIERGYLIVTANKSKFILAKEKIQEYLESIVIENNVKEYFEKNWGENERSE